MSARNRKEWIIGAEYCAYDIVGEKIVGIKFVKIVDETKNKVIGKLWERYRFKTIEFSKITGKEYRGYGKYYWLTLRKKIERSLHEENTCRNRKNRRLDCTSSTKTIRSPLILDMENRIREIRKLRQMYETKGGNNV